MYPASTSWAVLKVALSAYRAGKGAERVEIKVEQDKVGRQVPLERNRVVRTRALPLSSATLITVAALDNTLYYLERSPNHAAFNLATIQRGGDKGVLVFQEVALASKHLKNLPEEVSVRALDDERAKEEFLRVALRQGATQVWFDVDAERLEPKAVQPLTEALFYILSFRREAACL